MRWNVAQSATSRAQSADRFDRPDGVADVEFKLITIVVKFNLSKLSRTGPIVRGA